MTSLSQMRSIENSSSVTTSVHAGKRERERESEREMEMSDRALDSISENLREDSSGSYTVRGITYLEGNKHEDKLYSGVECEIFIEAVDDWMTGSITACKEIAVPHTSLKLKTYSVQYLLQSAEGEQKEVTEHEVKSDRLRLILDTTSHLVTSDGAVVHTPVHQIVESTGLGAWTTVSVRVVTEEEEEREREKIAEEEREREREEQIGKEKQSQLLAEELAREGSDSALSAYDVYNTGMYKGVRIGSELIESEVESISGGQKVGFKKRKVTGRGGGGGGGEREREKAISNGESSSGVRVFRRKEL
eukprot:CAMPEP_0182425358 /NCGR_PEP_ID=MMETSP1167-20130531/11767_1 /TAXON_ID=2988 /ORGANISM="Mallomonas Sp, Strain CCMP3275" /LENGTH=304 /DNA_ID=CAMNT_0024605999 /DNA_START=553 /DNA_END=1467 /DNA_ORIENTATION=-